MTDTVKVLSDDALREIEARANAATNPPWHAQSIEMSLEADKWMRGDNNHNDALFMAHAREDIPALCATVRALREDLRQGELCEECEQWSNNEDGSPQTFLVCGVCWNKLQETNTALREQLAAEQQGRQSYQSGLLLECGCLLKQDSPDTEPRIIAHCDKGEP